MRSQASGFGLLKYAQVSVRVHTPHFGFLGVQILAAKSMIARLSSQVPAASTAFRSTSSTFPLSTPKNLDATRAV
ncbi:MAG: hypothetical protein QXT84_06020, partial [Candidatus Bathyarchaeia archaeon]